MGALAGAGLLAIIWRIIGKQSRAEEYYCGFFFALLLVVIHRWDFAIATNRLCRPVTYCGIMCYSLYLVHWPVVKPLTHLLYISGVQGPWPTLAVSMPLALGASIAIGWAFHMLVERRFLNTPPVLPWQSPVQKAAPAPAAAPLPIVPPSAPL